MSWNTSDDSLICLKQIQCLCNISTNYGYLLICINSFPQVSILGWQKLGLWRCKRKVYSYVFWSVPCAAGPFPLHFLLPLPDPWPPSLLLGVFRSSAGALLLLSRGARRLCSSSNNPCMSWVSSLLWGLGVSEKQTNKPTNEQTDGTHTHVKKQTLVFCGWETIPGENSSWNPFHKQSIYFNCFKLGLSS